MKKKKVKIKPGIIKYLMLLPVFLLAFCQSEYEEPISAAENKLTIDAKVLSLMRSAIQSDSDQTSALHKSSLSKDAITNDDGQCTNFLYPMTFQVFSGDDPVPVTKEINSDEELIAFIEEFTYENSAGVYTPNYEMFIYFPIVLLDTDGNETVLNNLTELEGTLQMAVQACESFNTSSEDTSSDGSDGGSSDGSDGGSSDGSDGDSSDGSDGGSSDGSDGGSGDGSDGGSSDGSDGGSTGGSDGGSSDGSDGGSSDGSDDDSGDDSGDDSDDDSGDDSDDDSSDGSDDDSGDDSDDDTSQSSTESLDNDDDDDNGFKFCDKNNKKVYICHKGKTICVSVNAIWGHLEHHEEDFLGTCEDD